MANDGIGGAGVAKRESIKKVASSRLSLRLANPPISLTEESIHGLEIKLENLQQSMQNYIDAGGKISVVALPERFNGVAVVLEGVAK